MRQIEPFTIWTEEGNKTAEYFDLAGSGDDYKSSATSYYRLFSSSGTDEQGNLMVGEIIKSGYVSILPQDYAQWDGSNEWIINWTANKLGLIFVQ